MINPRSLASIREAIREGRAKTRGELQRLVVEAYSAPRIARRVKEAEGVVKTPPADKVGQPPKSEQVPKKKTSK